jgi:hypothetical protein
MSLGNAVCNSSVHRLARWYWRGVLLMPLFSALSGCMLNLNSPQDTLIGLGVGVGRNLGNNARRTAASFDADVAASAFENGRLTKAGHAKLEKQLTSITEDIRRLTLKIKLPSTEDSPIHEPLPQVPIVLTEDEEPYANAVQGPEPFIEISAGMIKNLLKPIDEAYKTRNQYQPRDIFDSLTALMMEQISIPAAKIQYREAIGFILAHEVTHIWLDPPVEARQPGEGIFYENRADAYGIVFSTQISPAAAARIQAQAEFSRTLRFQTSDPVTTAYLSAEVGANLVLKVYSSLGFAEGNDTHLPFSERVKLVEAKVQEIYEQEVNNKSDFAVFGTMLVRKVLFE